MTEKSNPSQIADAIQYFDQLPDSAGVRGPVVKALNGHISNATLYRWIRLGILPPPGKAGPGTRASIWNVGELRAKQRLNQTG